MRPEQPPTTPNKLLRARTLYAALIFVLVIVMVRLFYLQVIKHSYYKNSALLGQYKEYEIPPRRGAIQAKDGDSTVPLVLNEERYTLFADPEYVQDIDSAAQKLVAITGDSPEEYAEKMRQDTRYAVLKKELKKTQSEAVEALEIKGIGTRAESYRTYPQGTTAAQLLGFVNSEGVGTYGVEQALNDTLKGKPGQLKAITDANGIPLVANSDNVNIEPEAGENIILTIDVPMQKQLEDILNKGLQRAQSKSGTALILDPSTGAVKAMANYPTYNPDEFEKVTDTSRFNNGAVSSPLEVGSIMKPLTAAAALDSGAVQPTSEYYDPGYFVVDEKKITNVEEVAGAGTRKVVDVLRLSLNTGATWLLMQMGDGTINEKARTTWHNYMTNHYQLGKQTGIEQGYEEAGSIPDPNDGFGLNIQYANSAFGQGMSATPLQMGAAIASVINGGTYYRPRLVEAIEHKDGSRTVVEPKVVRDNVVNQEVSKTIVSFMEEVVKANYTVYGMRSLRTQYSIGGKTGTAQITRPEGGYYEDRYNGMFMGFVGGKKPQYVIIVRVNDPKIPGYAGSRAAGPIFTDTIDMLINNFAVTPK